MPPAGCLHATSSTGWLTDLSHGQLIDYQCSGKMLMAFLINYNQLTDYVNDDSPEDPRLLCANSIQMVVHKPKNCGVESAH